MFIKKLPAGIMVDALVFRPNKVYGWGNITSVETNIKTKTHKIMTDLYGFSFDSPAFAKEAKFVTLPADFFSVSDNIKELILGVVTSKYVKDFSVYARGRKRKIGLPTLFESDIKSFSSIVLSLNGIVFDGANYKGDIDNILLDYIENWNVNRIDVYLTHVLIKSGLLIPFIFSSSPIINLDILHVPVENYWVFQLLYGRYKTISTNADGNIVNINKINLRIKRKYQESNGVFLNLRSKNVQPVIINEGFAMRFI
jgi:hypothetical protein